MGFCDCCFGVSREQRQEEDRLASEEARSRAAEAAQRRAARAQMAAIKKQSDSASGGEPVLRWQMG
ncbi:unnamed protein product [Spirodela intermedia]|uniref:Uncharacterized protein n=1 Tax=Spirodela intermedia TaxID=51605 RepID=A0A7I8II32_SPIIN|nr:unnamed protein product [Spirodela intermedia]CAA6657535.1 unnamed protein product [Spirodela intermedia]